jgi:hypothetical protein
MERSPYNSETVPHGKLTNNICYLPFLFDKHRLADDYLWVTSLNDCGHIDNLGENVNIWLTF